MSSKFEFGRILGIFLIVAILVLLGLLAIQLMSPKFHPVNGDRLANALARYTREYQIRNGTRPKLVTLQDMLDQGYLTSEDAKPFEGAEVIFHGDADNSTPHAVLIEVRTPDGQVQAVLVDGSVQQFTREQWEQYRNKMTAGETAGRTSVSTPTNAMPR